MASTVPHKTDWHISESLSRKLSNAVEALSTIFYLLEQEQDNPEKARVYIGLGKSALYVLVGFVRQASDAGRGPAGAHEDGEDLTGTE